MPLLAVLGTALFFIAMKRGASRELRHLVNNSANAMMNTGKVLSCEYGGMEHEVDGAEASRRIQEMSGHPRRMPEMPGR